MHKVRGKTLYWFRLGIFGVNQFEWLPWRNNDGYRGFGYGFFLFSGIFSVCSIIDAVSNFLDLRVIKVTKKLIILKELRRLIR